MNIVVHRVQRSAEGQPCDRRAQLDRTWTEPRVEEVVTAMTAACRALLRL